MSKALTATEFNFPGQKSVYTVKCVMYITSMMKS